MAATVGIARPWNRTWHDRLQAVAMGRPPQIDQLVRSSGADCPKAGEGLRMSVVEPTECSGSTHPQAFRVVPDEHGGGDGKKAAQHDADDDRGAALARSCAHEGQQGPLPGARLVTESGFQRSKTKRRTSRPPGGRGRGPLDHERAGTRQRPPADRHGGTSRLLSQGIARPPAPLGLGLETTRSLQLLRRSGRPNPSLFALGPLTRGTFWETSAVPEIREQGRTLAKRLVMNGAARAA